MVSVKELSTELCSPPVKKAVTKVMIQPGQSTSQTTFFGGQFFSFGGLSRFSGQFGSLGSLLRSFGGQFGSLGGLSRRNDAPVSQQGCSSSHVGAADAFSVPREDGTALALVPWSSRSASDNDASHADSTHLGLFDASASSDLPAAIQPSEFDLSNIQSSSPAAADPSEFELAVGLVASASRRSECAKFTSVGRRPRVTAPISVSDGRQSTSTALRRHSQRSVVAAGPEDGHSLIRRNAAKGHKEGQLPPAVLSVTESTAALDGSQLSLTGAASAVKAAKAISVSGTATGPQDSRHRSLTATATSRDSRLASAAAGNVIPSAQPMATEVPQATNLAARLQQILLEGHWKPFTSSAVVGGNKSIEPGVATNSKQHASAANLAAATISKPNASTANLAAANSKPNASTANVATANSKPQALANLAAATISKPNASAANLAAANSRPNAPTANHTATTTSKPHASANLVASHARSDSTSSDVVGDFADAAPAADKSSHGESIIDANRFQHVRSNDPGTDSDSAAGSALICHSRSPSLSRKRRNSPLSRQPWSNAGVADKSARSEATAAAASSSSALSEATSCLRCGWPNIVDQAQHVAVHLRARQINTTLQSVQEQFDADKSTWQFFKTRWPRDFGDLLQQCFPESDSDLQHAGVASDFAEPSNDQRPVSIGPVGQPSAAEIDGAAMTFSNGFFGQLDFADENCAASAAHSTLNGPPSQIKALADNVLGPVISSPELEPKANTKPLAELRLKYTQLRATKHSTNKLLIRLRVKMHRVKRNGARVAPKATNKFANGGGSSLLDSRNSRDEASSLKPTATQRCNSSAFDEASERNVGCHGDSDSFGGISFESPEALIEAEAIVNRARDCNISSQTEAQTDKRQLPTEPPDAELAAEGRSAEFIDTDDCSDDGRAEDASSDAAANDVSSDARSVGSASDSDATEGSSLTTSPKRSEFDVSITGHRLPEAAPFCDALTGCNSSNCDSSSGQLQVTSSAANDVEMASKPSSSTSAGSGSDRRAPSNGVDGESAANFPNGVGDMLNKTHLEAEAAKRLDHDDSAAVSGAVAAADSLAADNESGSLIAPAASEFAAGDPDSHDDSTALPGTAAAAPQGHIAAASSGADSLNFQPGAGSLNGLAGADSRDASASGPTRRRFAFNKKLARVAPTSTKQNSSLTRCANALRKKYSKRVRIGNLPRFRPSKRHKRSRTSRVYCPVCGLAFPKCYWRRCGVCSSVKGSEQFVRFCAAERHVLGHLETGRHSLAVNHEELQLDVDDCRSKWESDERIDEALRQIAACFETNPKVVKLEKFTHCTDSRTFVEILAGHSEAGSSPGDEASTPRAASISASVSSSGVSADDDDAESTDSNASSDTSVAGDDSMPSGSDFDESHADSRILSPNPEAIPSMAECNRTAAPLSADLIDDSADSDSTDGAANSSSAASTTPPISAGATSLYASSASSDKIRVPAASNCADGAAASDFASAVLHPGGSAAPDSQSPKRKRHGQSNEITGERSGVPAERASDSSNPAVHSPIDADGLQSFAVNSRNDANELRNAAANSPNGNDDPQRSSAASPNGSDDLQISAAESEIGADDLQSTAAYSQNGADDDLESSAAVSPNGATDDKPNSSAPSASGCLAVSAAAADFRVSAMASRKRTAADSASDAVVAKKTRNDDVVVTPNDTANCSNASATLARDVATASDAHIEDTIASVFASVMLNASTAQPASVDCSEAEEIDTDDLTTPSIPAAGRICGGSAAKARQPVTIALPAVPNALKRKRSSKVDDDDTPKPKAFKFELREQRNLRSNTRPIREGGSSQRRGLRSNSRPSCVSISGDCKSRELRQLIESANSFILPRRRRN